ncbi:MAG: TetR/AcrR family transcriptional regulator [Desulfobacterales bacterium]|nr:TetR/AcrR family transcriptional regulator [Desulfobacterales bacterium]
MSKKQEILESATRLFARKDFREASMAELSQVADVADSTIFYHFKTKEALFLAVLKNVRTGIIEKFNSYMAHRTFENGLSAVEGVVAFYLYTGEICEDWFLLLNRNYPYQLAVENTDCREHLEAIFNNHVDMFEQAIQRGQADGTIGALPPRKTAIILFSLIDSFVRCKSHNLFEPGELYNEFVDACRRILIPAG